MVEIESLNVEIKRLNTELIKLRKIRKECWTTITNNMLNSKRETFDFKGKTYNLEEIKKHIRPRSDKARKEVLATVLDDTGIYGQDREQLVAHLLTALKSKKVPNETPTDTTKRLIINIVLDELNYKGEEREELFEKLVEGLKGPVKSVEYTLRLLTLEQEN